MNREKLERNILEALAATVPGTDVDIMDPAISFRDQLEIDSIDFLNFVLLLEKKLDLKVPEIDYPKLSTLDGCISFFETHHNLAD